MFVSENLSVLENGHLAIGGVDTVELAERFGTPLYVFDEEMIRAHCAMYKRSIDRFYGGRGLVCYASKAFSCKEIYRIAKDEGIGVDVVSLGELATAMSVDFPAEAICLHGNNKSAEELRAALEYGVGRIVVDNFDELHLLDRLAEEAGCKASILLRVKPGIDAHTHSFIRTGQIDSKFGFALETGEALDAAKKAVSCPHLELRGLHCHIGSQIFDIAPFALAAERLLCLFAEVKKETGVLLEDLNLGGGFGIKYTQEDQPIPYELYMETVAQTIHATCEQLGLPMPFILMEPGRSIVGPAGITLYRVGNVKTIPGIRTYVAVDGGMTDNPRYALYQSKYDIEVANRAGEPKDARITLAGRCCESGDLLGEHMPVQPVQPGDILAVLATGAYNYAMASHYNRVPNPAAVMVRDGEARVIIRRETPDDLMRFDV